MANTIDGADAAAQLLFSRVVQELSDLKAAAEQPAGIVFFKTGVEQIYLKVVLGPNSVEINVAGEKGVIDPKARNATSEPDAGDSGDGV